jgi:NAD+ synthetase
MRIALAQVDTTVGDLAGNAALVRQNVDRARESKADVVVFPELTLCGYPPRDLLDRPSFLARGRETLDRLAGEIRGITAVVGFVDVEEESGCRRLYNAAAVIRNGEVVAVRRKTLLPTYDVFDEDRHFEPCSTREPVDLCGIPVGITICEDIWNEPTLRRRRAYDSNPPQELVQGGAALILNLSASPYHLGREKERLALLRTMAERLSVPVLLCNQVGGNDELIFDGNSLAVGKNGELLAAAAAFEEDLAVVDTESPGSLPVPDRYAGSLPGGPVPDAIDVDQGCRALALGIRDYVRKCRFSDVLVGLSGGIDSCLVAALATEALGADHVTGVAMPSPYSSDESLEDALALSRNLGVRCLTLPIGDLLEGYRRTLAPVLGPGNEDGSVDITFQNVQARIRGALLMAISNRTGSMVLSTGNKSELSVGYCTLYGDMAGGLAAISDVPKVLVYEMCRSLNRTASRPIIPDRVLTKPPSAELSPGQKDVDSLPPYELLDPVLREFIEEERGIEEIVARGFDRDLVRRVVGLVVSSEYKRRQAPPGLRITTKAFGSGRRMPLAQGYRG